MRSIGKGALSVDSVRSAIAGLSKENMIAVLSTTTLSEEQIKAALASDTLKGAELDQAVAATLSAQANRQAAASTRDMGVVFTGLTSTIKSSIAATKTFLLTSPAGWATLAVGAIAGLSIGLAAYSREQEKKLEEARENIEEITSSINEMNEALKNTESVVKSSGDRFAELAQGINMLTGKNASLSTDDYEEFLEISNELLEVFPTLPHIYDENGNAIVQLTGDVDGIVGSLNDLVQVQRELMNQELADKLPELHSSLSTTNSGYTREIEILEHQIQRYQENASELSALGADGRTLDEIRAAAWDEYSTIDISTSNDDIFHYNLVNEILSDEDVRTIDEAVAFYQQKFVDANQELQETLGEQQQSWSKLNQSLAAWLFSSNPADYTNLSDEAQAGIQNIMNSLNWSEIGGSLDDKQGLITSIIEAVNDNENNPELAEAFTNLFSLEPGDLDRVEFAKMLQELLNDVGIEIDITPLVSNEQSAQDRLAQSINWLSYGSVEGYNDLRELTKDFTVEQVEAWLEATNGAQSAEEAAARYAESIKSAAISTSQLDLANMDEIPRKLADIESAYETVADAIAEYNQQGYLSMSTVDSLLDLDDEYLNMLTDENGQLSLNRDAFINLAKAKIENAKAAVYQEATIELNRIALLNAKDAANELALANGTLAESAYEAAHAAYLETIALGGVNAQLAQNVWNAASVRVGLLEAQLSNLTKGVYRFSEAVEETMDKYDKALSAVQAVLDDRIDALEDEKDAIEDRYELEISYIEEQIKLLEARKDEINDANDALERQLALEKAQFELDRLRNQRTIREWNGEEFVYVGDTDAISDASETLEQAKLDIEIAKLDEAIAQLERQQETLELAKDAELGAIDELIEKYNEYAEMWDGLSTQVEDEQARMYAAELMGAEWESEVLDMRLDTFTNFADKYIEQQKRIEAASGSSSSSSGSISTGSIDTGVDFFNVTMSNGMVLRSTLPYDAAVDYKNKLISENGYDQNSIRIIKAARGGVLDSNDNPYSHLASLAGEDGLVAFRDGERMLTAQQNVNFEKLVELADIAMNRSIPRNVNPITYGSQSSSVVYQINGNLEFPNITNGNQVDLLIKNLERLANDAKARIV